MRIIELFLHYYTRRSYLTTVSHAPVRQHVLLPPLPTSCDPGAEQHSASFPLLGVVPAQGLYTKRYNKNYRPSHLPATPVLVLPPGSLTSRAQSYYHCRRHPVALSPTPTAPSVHRVLFFWLPSVVRRVSWAPHPPLSAKLRTRASNPQGPACCSLPSFTTSCACPCPTHQPHRRNVPHTPPFQPPRAFHELRPPPEPTLRPRISSSAAWVGL
jgi:hypothetical protein